MTCLYFRKLSCLILCALLLQLPCFANEIKKLNVPEAEGERDYYATLLHIALERGADGRALPKFVAAPYMEQQRMFVELRRGGLVDVNWAAANKQWANDLRMISIPLDRGLLGYRRFIIRKDMVDKFNKVKTIADLSAYSACQGNGWPDATIMREAGLSVREVIGFEPLYQLVASGRCAYFPRGYIEAASEMITREKRYPELMIYNKLILYYPQAMYFYVSRNNEELAQWIETGLERMIDSGEFSKHMQKHLLNKTIFPFSNEAQPRFIEVANSLFPQNIDVKNPRYWIENSDFHSAKH